MAGNLDMTLDDVIKHKIGKTSGGRANAAKKEARPGKGRSRQGKGSGRGGKASSARLGNERNKGVVKSKLWSKGNRKSRLGNEKSRLVQLPQGFSRFLGKAGSGKREQRTKTSDPTGTSDKLGMTLDDLMKRKSKTGAKPSAEGRSKRGGLKKGVGTFALRQQKKKAANQGNAKGKGKGNLRMEYKGKGKGKRIDWEPSGMRRRRGQPRDMWLDEDSWKGKGGRKGGVENDFGWGRRKGKGGRKGGDDFRGSRGGDDFRGSKGGGKLNDYVRGSKGGGRRAGDDFRGSGDADSRGAGKDRRRQEQQFDRPDRQSSLWGNRGAADDRDDPLGLWGGPSSRGGGKGGGAYADRFGSGGKRRMSDDWEPPLNKRQRQAEPRGSGAMRSAGDRDDFSGGRGAMSRGPSSRGPGSRAGVGASRKIRVSNIPKNLDKRDIEEAFSETGRLVSVQVDRGVAFITFETTGDARQAVQTFDRGELNGQTIRVTFE